MFSHPDTIVTSTQLHCQELLATAARERRTAGISGPAVEWRSLAVRISAVVALVLGLRG